MKPCVVIPAFNERAHIGEVVSRARRHVEDVIVVDDGSSDGTGALAAAAGARVLRHERNLGKGAALKSGMSLAFADGFDPVVLLDGDTQHDCGEIPKFLEAARARGADIVVGNRMGETEGMPFIRCLTNRVTSFFISRLAGQEIPDSQCGFRLIRERAFRLMRFRTARYETEGEMLIQAARAGCAIVSLPVKTIYGRGKSKINPLMDTIRFVRLMLLCILSRK